MGILCHLIGEVSTLPLRSSVSISSGVVCVIACLKTIERASQYMEKQDTICFIRFSIVLSV